METTTRNGVTVTVKATDTGVSLEMNHNGETSITDTLDPTNAARLGAELIRLSADAAADQLMMPSPLPKGTTIQRLGEDGAVGGTRFKIIGWLPNKRHYVLERVNIDPWPKNSETSTWPADRVRRTI